MHYAIPGGYQLVRLAAYIAMSSLASSYQKKYVTLRDAAIISGYTVAELRNFAKIGLVPFKKKASRLYVRFDAFEKISEHTSAQRTAAQATAPAAAAKTKTKTMTISTRPTMSLLPFTAPNRTLVKILEPVAFAAALVMTLHLALLPAYAEKIVVGLEISAGSVALMGDSLHAAVSATVRLPETLGTELARAVTSSPGTYPVQVVRTVPPAVASGEGIVAGVVTNNSAHFRVRSAALVPQEPAYEAGPVESMLIGIADVSQALGSFMDELSVSTQSAMVETLSFDKLDPFVTNTFRW